MNDPVPAVPQLIVLEEFDHDPNLPTDDSPLFTVLVLVLVVAVFIAVSITAVIGGPRLLLRDGFGVGRCEEDVERLSKADCQTNERDERYVQGASLDLLEVLPVHVTSLSGLFERPFGSVAESP